MKIKKIETNNILEHTWDISTPSETYLLSNGCVSHNSSLVTNSTNGIEPVKSLLTVKKSKKGTIKQIVPQYSTLKHYYSLQWELPDNTGYMNIAAAIQKFFDQGISTNSNYDPLQYSDQQIPIQQALMDILYAYKIGQKTHYYCNVKDGKTDDTADEKEHEKQQNDLYGKLDTKEEESCSACTL
jgi:ribonucleoside-diphosphate reductase alpha chain